MQCEIRIRTATLKDAKCLSEIYAPYVKETAISFEYEVPSPEEFQRRIEKIQKHYPYLVAECDGEIAGYAYVSAFHERAAYAWCAETSIYIEKRYRKMGIGRKLYDALESICREMGILNLYACIAYPETEDEYLTKNSVKFHEHLGYRLIGEFRQCGYKFDRWYNMVWMEKMIGVHGKDQMPVRKLEEILAFSGEEKRGSGSGKMVL